MVLWSSQFLRGKDYKEIPLLIQLPKHGVCGSHKLNNTATTDAGKLLDPNFGWESWDLRGEPMMSHFFDNMPTDVEVK